jgi:hypothetical protein
MLRDLGRGLGEDLGVDRNETDGTRNTDKPSSVFHISHHLVSFVQAHETYLIVTQKTGAEKGSVNASGQLKVWITTAKITEGPIFRPIVKGGRVRRPGG